MDRPLDNKTETPAFRAKGNTTGRSIVFQKQLLATKFYVPVASGPLIARPRLITLLDESSKYPLTLVSAPAGSGKTTLLAVWGQALAAKNIRLAWLSLDEEDNEPWLFWTYVLSALQQYQPERFTPLLAQIEPSQEPLLKYILTALINLIAESTECFVLILDSYQMITEHEVHTTLAYLVEHLAPQLRIIIATRSNSSLLQLSHLRAHQKVLEIRTNQLRCTAEETKAFFKEVVGMQFPDQTIQDVTMRTEGWLVGLQLLGLSLPEQADPFTLLEEASGYQRYILDYLTEEVLRRQPQKVQNFLLSTCILKQLTASLCDAVMQQHSSQQLLEELEQANLFVVSLDSKREWYRYHTLFAEALYYRLEQTQRDLLPTLHHHASLWYAEHNQTTQAILHAFRAKEWVWVADLIEQKIHHLMSQTWAASQHELAIFRQWLEQLPAEITHSRPRLCLASALLLWQIVEQPKIEAWLDMAETIRTTSTTTQTDVSATMLTPKAKEGPEDLLGEIFAWRAFMSCPGGDGQVTHSLCQQALSLLSADNSFTRAIVNWTQLQSSYVSSDNDAEAAIQSGLQAGLRAQETEQLALAIGIMGSTACCMIGAGRLYEAQRLTEQAKLLGKLQTGPILPYVGYPALFQHDILREWNQLDTLPALVLESIELCKQAESMSLLIHLLHGYGILLRVYLSRGELDAAQSALQEIEHIGMGMNQHLYLHVRSIFTTVDQVRLWLACGDLKRATCWIERLDLGERLSTPFEREREEVAYARILLAKHQPTLTLQRLEPVLQRATIAQRRGHIIEIRLLQAQAYQMCDQEKQALLALSEAIRLSEPEGYIRSFVDEGNSMAILLSQLREEQSKDSPTPYLDTLLAAFQQESKKHEPQPKQESKKHTSQLRRVTEAQIQPDPLTRRELEVLYLLASGASNHAISQELAITIDTVKRHVSHIFSKLGAQNRIQATRSAQDFGLIDK